VVWVSEISNLLECEWMNAVACQNPAPAEAPW
jgi:hypothetical protein